jgi:hypothetical protein
MFRKWDVGEWTCGILCDWSQWQSQYNTYKYIYYGLSSTVGCHMNSGSIAKISGVCHLSFPSGVDCRWRGRMLWSEEAPGRLRAVMCHWMRSWLAGDPWWILMADVGAVAVAVLDAAGQHALMRSGVVLGPRGIVAGQSGVVSSFLICPVHLSLLDVFSPVSERWMKVSLEMWPLFIQISAGQPLCYLIFAIVGGRGLLHQYPLPGALNGLFY